MNIIRLIVPKEYKGSYLGQITLSHILSIIEASLTRMRKRRSMQKTSGCTNASRTMVTLSTLLLYLMQRMMYASSWNIPYVIIRTII